LEILINCKSCRFPEGASFIDVVTRIRASKKDDPVLQAVEKRTGKDPLMYVLNGLVIRPQEYDSTEIKEGDSIRYIYPHAGG